MGMERRMMSKDVRKPNALSWMTVPMRLGRKWYEKKRQVSEAHAWLFGQWWSLSQRMTGK